MRITAAVASVCSDADQNSRRKTLDLPLILRKPFICFTDGRFEHHTAIYRISRTAAPPRRLLEERQKLICILCERYRTLYYYISAPQSSRSLQGRITADSHDENSKTVSRTMYGAPHSLQDSRFVCMIFVAI